MIRRKLFEEKLWRNFVEIYKQNLLQTQKIKFEAGPSKNQVSAIVAISYTLHFEIEYSESSN